MVRVTKEDTSHFIGKKVLIVDDMLDHLDDQRANQVFDGLANIKDIQVIIAGVKGSENLPSYVIQV